MENKCKSERIGRRKKRRETIDRTTAFVRRGRLLTFCGLERSSERTKERLVRYRTKHATAAADEEEGEKQGDIRDARGHHLTAGSPTHTALCALVERH